MKWKVATAAVMLVLFVNALGAQTEPTNAQQPATQEQVKRLQEQITAQTAEYKRLANQKTKQAKADREQLEKMMVAEKAAYVELATRLEQEEKNNADREKRTARQSLIMLSGVGLLVLLGVSFIVRRALRGRSAMETSTNVLLPELGDDPEPKVVEHYLRQTGSSKKKCTTRLAEQGLVFEYTAFLRDNVGFALFEGQKKEEAVGLYNRRKAARKLYDAGLLQPKFKFPPADASSIQPTVIH